MMSEEPDFTPPEDHPVYGRYEFDANVSPPGQDTLVTIFSYDCQDRLTAVIDPTGPADSSSWSPLGSLIDCYGGQVVKSIREDAGYCARPNPAWTFRELVLKVESVCDIYIFSAKRLSGMDWQNNYSVSAGTLTLATEFRVAPLGDDWYKLGTVTLPGCTSALTISYHGKGAAADVVWLVGKDAVGPVEEPPADL
jgi:hypothetical protein